MDFVFCCFAGYFILDPDCLGSGVVHLDLLPWIPVAHCRHEWYLPVFTFTNNFEALALVTRFDMLFDLVAHIFPSVYLLDAIDSSSNSRVAEIHVIPINDSSLCAWRDPNLRFECVDLYSVECFTAEVFAEFSLR